MNSKEVNFKEFLPRIRPQNSDQAGQCPFHTFDPLSRPNWGHPTPSPASEFVPPTTKGGGGQTRLRGGGGGSQFG
jgi:hypothetical protein